MDPVAAMVTFQTYRQRSADSTLDEAYSSLIYEWDQDWRRTLIPIGEGWYRSGQSPAGSPTLVFLVHTFNGPPPLLSLIVFSSYDPGLLWEMHRSHPCALPILAADVRSLFGNTRQIRLDRGTCLWLVYELTMRKSLQIFLIVLSFSSDSSVAVDPIRTIVSFTITQFVAFHYSWYQPQLLPRETLGFTRIAV